MSISTSVNRAIGDWAYRLGMFRGGRRIDGLASCYLAGRKSYNYDPTVNGEYWLLDAIAALAPTTILDVGANHGHWTAAVISRMPQCQVHAFEINHKLVAALKLQYTTARHAVVVNDFGLSDRNGRMPAKFFTEDTLGTLIDTVDLHDHLDPEIEEVEVRTLDNYVVEHKILGIDLLKIDVEGAEHQVLNGAAELLRNKQVRLIQFEYGYANAYTHFLMNDYNKLFAGYGYKIGKLCHDGVDFSPYHVEMNNFESGPNYVACLDDDVSLALFISPAKAHWNGGASVPMFLQYQRLTSGPRKATRPVAGVMNKPCLATQVLTGSTVKAVVLLRTKIAGWNEFVASE